MNAQREVIYKRRRNALHGDRIRTDIANMFFDLVEMNVDSTHEHKDFESFKLGMLANMGMESPIDEGQYMGEKADNLIYEIYSKAELHYRSKLDDLSQRAHPVIKRVHDDESNDFKSILVPFTDGRKTIQVSTDIEESVATEAKSVMKSLEKQVVLAVIDQHWKEHLRSMDDLRSNVQHARHEQKDPLLIYKFESYELFKKMVSKVNAEVASFLMKCTIPSNPNEQRITQARKQESSPQGTTSKEGVKNLSQQSSRACR